MGPREGGERAGTKEPEEGCGVCLVEKVYTIEPKLLEQKTRMQGRKQGFQPTLVLVLLPPSGLIVFLP